MLQPVCQWTQRFYARVYGLLAIHIVTCFRMWQCHRMVSSERRRDGVVDVEVATDRIHVATKDSRLIPQASASRAYLFWSAQKLILPSSFLFGSCTTPGIVVSHAQTPQIGTLSVASSSSVPVEVGGQ